MGIATSINAKSDEKDRAKLRDETQRIVRAVLEASKKSQEEDARLNRYWFVRVWRAIFQPFSL